MIIDIFLILVILISLGILVRILLSKFPVLVKINIEEISKEKERRLKFKILEKKFVKKIKIKNLFNQFLGKKIKKLKEKISFLEEKYFKKYIEIIKERPLEIEKKINDFLKEGEEFLEKKDFDQAEKKFKKVISLNPRNLIALKSLLKIYLFKKNFSRARKISKYLLELSKQAMIWWQKFRREQRVPQELINELILSFINLGTIYQEIGENWKAIECFKEALEYDPNNPRILDFLIENSIILKRKKEARDYLTKIKEVNPENQKIKEWKERIKNIV